MTQTESRLEAAARDLDEVPARPIKCLVWDLDNTLWRGVLLEGDDVEVDESVVAVIRTLDERGIVHSIASRNDHDAAVAKLQALGLDDLFLHPQIHWGAKSVSVARIAEELNIGLDAIGFIDDQPFERAEVRAAHPSVVCFEPGDVPELPTMPALRPRFITNESRVRRRLYQSDAARKRAETEHGGAPKAFLEGLGLRMRIREASADDLARVEELTLRTNQLNANGRTYDYEELDGLRVADDHTLLVASLEDRFGSYGTIGVVLVERLADRWTLRLLLMSCRVMSRGVGSVMLGYVIDAARDAGVRLFAELVDTGRNRAMLVTFRFGGFKPASPGTSAGEGSSGQARGDANLYEHPLDGVAPPSTHVAVDAVAPSLRP